ncbi:hypothetical protein AOC36_06355 [Erysipelothrix larvae]|uniref:Serine protease n=1 Tax=Erysipelothrix larvae TaxID=1514105 RepID=A0A0X8H079_9FIRM|nr:serine protease [Erysipelothrix larvae]AMC93620.1 hypothetical protein AOC36_06355 [Erysipelothrix larvae]
MSKKRRWILSIIVLFSVFSVLYLKISNDQFDINSVDQTTKLSNIRIVSMITKGNEDFKHISYDSGSSGSIFYKTGNTYYALTAYHVVPENKSNSYIVLTENDKSMREYMNEGGQYMGVDQYYAQFPRLNIVAVDKENDIAIVSFVSSQDLTLLPFASVGPQKGERCVTISNPDGRHGVVSSGKITTNKPQRIHYSNREKDVMAIKHSAHISYGSSGSALLNEDFEIIGVNIGGQKATLFNFELSYFDRGNAVPLEKVVNLVKKSGIINGENH